MPDAKKYKVTRDFTDSKSGRTYRKDEAWTGNEQAAQEQVKIGNIAEDKG